MIEDQKTKEKNCIFYASDYHFEMISLPYISKKLEENNEIVILTDRSLEKTVKTLVSKINLNNEKKNKLLELNWNNNDDKKLDKIRKDITQKNRVEIFIKGNEEYIKRINKEVNDIVKDRNNIKIIDCYNIDEVSENMEDIVKNYDKVISTMKK